MQQSPAGRTKPRFTGVENGFHVHASIAYKYLIADKMRAAGQHFENIVKKNRMIVHPPTPLL